MKEGICLRKIVCFIAMSLDGYIATEQGNLDWLMQVEGEGDNGFQQFYESIDTILLGRKTFEHVLELADGKYPHPEKNTYVFTRQQGYSVDQVKCGLQTQVIHHQSIEFIHNLLQKPGKDIWLVGGSEFIAALEMENRIDELILTIAPVRLGSGIPLWRLSSSGLMKKWELAGHRKFGQFIQLHYINN